MSSFRQFDAFAAARGEGLHPKLRSLLDRTAASPRAELTVRLDGMLQAGPDPASEANLRVGVANAQPEKLGKIAR
ncbi:hypothetical protein [Tardiphaga sp.]|uniref:hypothetical protein n=1 Tax=Tardiphaga sp. TaxID=1926292 RepID=UPI00263A23D6|nr:hypothetical protein [Tardiphaga sp.]MDB5620410.1 hypothetical protein [Tardiphaga sp.]